jgi:hypothetical protein
MKDIYVVVPHGTLVLAAADDFDRASMAMADHPLVCKELQMEVVNVNLLEEGD